MDKKLAAGSYDKPAHHVEALKEIHGHAGATLESQSKPKADGYKEHHKQTDMIQDGAPANKGPEPMLAHSQRRHPAINPHGFGHAGSQRQGPLRMSGHKHAHRLGAPRKGK